MGMLRIVGMDPSMSNWGVASGLYNTTTQAITIDYLNVMSPIKPTGKSVRQNSKDLTAAHQLAAVAWEAIKGAQAVFVEVPHGSQSARAMASYGMCVGILGALRSQGHHFFEITPMEVKLAATNNKTATKSQMIEWATRKHPDAPWPYRTQKGEITIVEGKAEHMADAVAAIHAGVQLPSFQQALMFHK